MGSGGDAVIEALPPYAENCPAALAENAAEEFAVAALEGIATGAKRNCIGKK